MASDFDKYAAKGNEFLNLLKDDLQVPAEKASRILRAVLHGLRNHLSIQESMQLLAQLPMALKGIYVDQWDISKTTPRIHHLSGFLEEIRNIDKGLAGYDFGNDENAARVVKAVFRTMAMYVSGGELENIIGMLPREIQQFMRESVSSTRMV